MQNIQSTLSDLLSAITKCRAQYRVIGSLLITAFLGKQHRKIKDLDVVVNLSDLNCLTYKLKQVGYQVNEGRKYGKLFILSFTKPNRLPINFVLLGEFKKNYYQQNLGFGLKIRINNEFIKPTNYKINNTRFVGIPISSHYFMIKNSPSKPGRLVDFKALKGKTKKNLIKNPIKIYFKNTYLPGLYNLYSIFKDFSGKLRMKFGKQYEVFNFN